MLAVESGRLTITTAAGTCRRQVSVRASSEPSLARTARDACGRGSLVAASGCSPHAPAPSRFADGPGRSTQPAQLGLAGDRSSIRRRSTAGARRTRSGPAACAAAAAACCGRGEPPAWRGAAIRARPRFARHARATRFRASGGVCLGRSRPSSSATSAMAVRADVRCDGACSSVPPAATQRRARARSSRGSRAGRSSTAARRRASRGTGSRRP